MKIGMIAPPFLPCPPDGYGGVERIVADLCDHLVWRGNQVTLFAHPRSRTAAQLVDFGLPESKTFDWYLDDVHVASALSFRREFDLIHSHTIASLAFFSLLDTPTVTTIHGTTLSVRHVYEAFREQNVVAVSESQRRAGPASLNWIATVYNGIHLDEYRPDNGPREYLLHVGTLCRRKGTREAVMLARAVGLPIVLAGQVYPSDQEYFETEIAPHLDGSNVRYIGEVGGQEKVALFQRAKALVMPLQWEEPFGLVFVEASACGIPVLTLDRGAAAEVVEHGRSGFIGKTWEDLIEPALMLDAFSPASCRRSVERFSVDAMVEGYLEVYRRVVGG